MKMKKMLSLGLSLLMCATLMTGCSGNDNSTSESGSKTLKIAGLDGGYGTKGWDDEYKSDRMSSDSDLFRVNEGDGNIHLHDGVTLEEGATYVITVDMTDPSHAVMHAVKK